MSAYDEMTKAELLEHAKQVGASPANNDMTKAELVASIEAAGSEAPSQFATTTRTKDYMGRPLQNATPGVTDPARDYLSRAIGAGNTDYLGRALVP